MPLDETHIAQHPLAHLMCDHESPRIRPNRWQSRTSVVYRGGIQSRGAYFPTAIGGGCTGFCVVGAYIGAI